jgi:hypothetical protein
MTCWNNQKLHAATRPSKPFWNDPAAESTVRKSFCGARFFALDTDILHFAAQTAALDGLWIELGVGVGRTIRFLAERFPQHPIYGFDSFKGLPEDWVRGQQTMPKGTFAQERLPGVPSNVHLIEGWFRDSLPLFAALQKKPIAFLHVDCDLYSSTRESLQILADQIIPGTVILFDEFYNYPGCEAHEAKALQEFLQKKPLTYRVLAFNALHEQVAIEIKAS